MSAGLSFGKAELLRAVNGTLAKGNPPRLPAPQLLGFDEVCDLDEIGGIYGQGFAVAHKATADLDWVFACHFRTDPVMPGGR